MNYLCLRGKTFHDQVFKGNSMENTRKRFMARYNSN